MRNIKNLIANLAFVVVLCATSTQVHAALMCAESNLVVNGTFEQGWFYAGTTTGTAWFDNVSLTPIVPIDPHPRWNILVLIYRDTNFTYRDNFGVQHQVMASMTQDEIAQAADAARQFVEQDIPALNSANMLPRLTIRYPERALTALAPNGTGWWPAPENTAGELDPAFDSVIVIWDPRATDQVTGQPIWIGSAAGLTPAMGTGQTYLAIIIEAAISYGHRNVFKHEWGHSITEYFNAAGTAPKPKVENHAVASDYVNCLTGAPYVWEDETDANPIRNSIYSNASGFTHDYYSGTTAMASEPTRCLGITPAAWALGGPVTTTNSASILTVNIAGAGSGSVNSNPSGIACVTGSSQGCSASFASGETVALSKLASANASFTGWTGDCSGTEGCEVVMDAAKDVTAIFSADPATVKIDGDNSAYYLLDSVLNSIAISGKTVRARNRIFIENVEMVNPGAIFFKGGYADSSFITRGTTSTTVIDGSLKIRKGSLRVERLSVR